MQGILFLKVLYSRNRLHRKQWPQMISVFRKNIWNPWAYVFQISLLFHKFSIWGGAICTVDETKLGRVEKYPKYWDIRLKICVWPLQAINYPYTSVLSRLEANDLHFGLHPKNTKNRHFSCMRPLKNIKNGKISS